MIPESDPETRNLPPGIHRATWVEIEGRYGKTARRRAMLRGLVEAIGALKSSGCARVYLDGSFITDKVEPGDFDGCWDREGVDSARLMQLAPELLLGFVHPRAVQKARFLGELFISNSPADGAGRTFLEFFQRDKRTEEPKDIILIELEGLP